MTIPVRWRRSLVGIFALPLLLVFNARPFLLAAGSPFDQDHPLWDQILKAYVSDGRVDYRNLKKDSQALDHYLQALRGVAPADFQNWSKEQKIAFWVNAYNAFVVETILDHYPLRKSWGWRTVLYPLQSIRQIPKVWDDKRFEALGRRLSLNDIEHQILRKQFQEPRIHFALVCASLGCPKLRGEAYAGSRLNEQLEDQVRQFLRQPNQLKIDPEKNEVWLSSLFKWFGEDFIPAFADPGRKEFSEKEGAVLHFISSTLSGAERDFLQRADFKIKYLDYDWSLNEKSYE